MSAYLSAADLDRLVGVERVHLVFKTHFDLGFTDLAARVADRYFDDFLPKAMEVARQSREAGTARFVWTLGSWLVYESLERSESSLGSQVEQAIHHGDLTWTAVPFTPHSELMGRDMFELGLSLSARLDRRFGTTTIAANLTDVPGHTIAIVPLLARAGVRFLHIGINPSSAVPDVPGAFRWRLASDEVVVSYTTDYGGVTRFGDSPDALLIVFTDDNAGPPESADVVNLYAELEHRLPGAVIDAGGMNSFAAASLEAAKGLPVLEHEIGDSWIHGAASDPGKLAAYRELVRLRATWLDDGSATETELDEAYRMLILVPEHTWGLDHKTFLGDWTTYEKAAFHEVCETGDFAEVAESWAEQRAYVAEAIDRLPERLARIARDRLESLAPTVAAPSTREPARPETLVENTQLALSIDPTSGAISHLREKATDCAYASEAFPLARAVYQTFDAYDYERFHHEYLRTRESWALKDFGKPGLQRFVDAESSTWTPQNVAVSHRRTADATHVHCELGFPEVCSSLFGAPRRLICEVSLRDDASELDVSLSWFDKDPVRVPEALWLTFQQPNARASAWTLDKLGIPISACDTVRSGGRLHAVEGGVRYTDEQRSLTIEMLDTPVVSPFGPSLLRFDNRLPDDQDGIAVCLFNNVWGTNFPGWYGDPGLARFVIRIGDRGNAPAMTDNGRHT